DGSFLSAFDDGNGAPRCDLILHHPPNSAASSDVIVPVNDTAVEQGSEQFRIANVQCKDQTKSNLPKALRNLNMGKWFPDGYAPGSGEYQIQPHVDYVRTVARYAEWFERPIRAVVHTKEFSEAALSTAAYF